MGDEDVAEHFEEWGRVEHGVFRLFAAQACEEKGGLGQGVFGSIEDRDVCADDFVGAGFFDEGVDVLEVGHEQGAALGGHFAA